MKQLFRAELYKVIHSKKVFRTYFLLIFLSVLLYGVSLKWPYMQAYVFYYDYTEEEKEVLNQITTEIITLGYRSRFQTYAYVEEDAMPLLLPGGALYEKYKEFNPEQKVTRMQVMYDRYFPPEETYVKEKIVWTKSLSDASAIIFTAVLFPILFFGTDWRERGYYGALLQGFSRRQFFIVRMGIYMSLVLSLSVFQLLLANLIYGGDFFGLPFDWIWRGFLLRFFYDIGLCMLLVPVSYLCRDVAKAMCAGIVGMYLFEAAFIMIVPTRPGELVWIEDVPDKVLGILALTAILVLSAAITLSYRLFRRAELK